MTGAQFLNAVVPGPVTMDPVVQTTGVVGYAAGGVGGPYCIWAVVSLCHARCDALKRHSKQRDVGVSQMCAISSWLDSIVASAIVSNLTLTIPHESLHSPTSKPPSDELIEVPADLPDDLIRGPTECGVRHQDTQCHQGIWVAINCPSCPTESHARSEVPVCSKTVWQLLTGPATATVPRRS
jgi:hypothetical protein